MDPLSHLVVAGTTGRVLQNNKTKPLWPVALLAGLSPDIDIIIRSSADPFWAVEMHRHFTHSFLMAPVMAALSMLVFLVFKKYRERFKDKKDLLKIFMVAVVAVYSHVLLDMVTSYGTRVFWPFSNARIYTDAMPIIDLFFTLPVAGLFIFALVKKSRKTAITALIYIFFYIGLASWQHHKAFIAQKKIAEKRGHSISHGRITPTLANINLWRSIYITEGKIYTDAFHVSFGSEIKHRKGTSARVVDIEQEKDNAYQYNYLKRFMHFSDGFAIKTGESPLSVADVRYAIPAHSLKPLWQLTFSDEKSSPPQFKRTELSDRINFNEFIKEVSGKSPGFMPLP